MWDIILLAAGIILGLTILGWPLAALTFLKNSTEQRFDFIFILSIALIIGFGISSFSASLAYSFIGINHYLKIIIGISALAWIFLIRMRKQFYFPKVSNLTVLILPSFFLIGLFFSKSQWDSDGAPILFSGAGADVPQNLLAANFATDLGGTWFEASGQLKSDLGAKNLDDAAYRLFEYPSQGLLAAADYLIFGLRWGLTIPFSQLINYLGPQVIWVEIGTVLLVSIFSVLLISFVMFRLIFNTNTLAYLCALILGLNGSFINQYFNGGLSQAFGLIGNISVLFGIVIVISKSSKEIIESQKTGIILFVTSGFLLSATAYVDGTFAPTLIIIILLVVYLLINRTLMKNLFKYIFIPGLITLLLMPLFTYLIFSNLDTRLRAVSGTGISTGVWKFPSQLLGFFAQYSYLLEAENKGIFIISFLVSTLILVVILVGLKNKDRPEFPFALLGISSCLIILSGFLIGFFGRNKSDYLYDKLSTYAAPFVILSFLTVIYFRFNSKNLRVLLLPIVVSICAITAGSALNVEDRFSKDRYAIIQTPASFSDLVKDRQLFEYLNENNYIMPYKPAYSFTGLFGVNYWISKAPNDLNLASRITNPLKLLCFSGDPVCNPNTPQITDARLAKYGLVEFTSSLNTIEFMNLSTLDRYNYVFDSFQQTRAIIPEKFMGGNPYYK